MKKSVVLKSLALVALLLSGCTTFSPGGKPHKKSSSVTTSETPSESSPTKTSESTTAEPTQGPTSDPTSESSYIPGPTTSDSSSDIPGPSSSETTSAPTTTTTGPTSTTATSSGPTTTSTPTSTSVPTSTSAPDPQDYYASIDPDATGDTLLSQLSTLNKSKRTSTVGYSAMGTSPSGMFKYTDYDPSTVQYDSNGQPYGTKIISFYSGNSTSSFNREHVWPKSHGSKSIEDDIHMPRPTIESENGSRGNSFYVEGKCDSKYGWDPAMESFGKADYRGDSARIIFYCMLLNSKFQLVEDEYHATTNDNPDYMMGKLSDMIRWHVNYPVQDRELRRNSGAQYLQGNRNPFIDHPEYVCRIWGNTNETTRTICGM